MDGLLGIASSTIRHKVRGAFSAQNSLSHDRPCSISGTEE